MIGVVVRGGRDVVGKEVVVEVSIGVAQDRPRAYQVESLGAKSPRFFGDAMSVVTHDG